MSTILVVEDSPIVRQPLEAALARAGYGTMSAEHGMQALDLLAKAPKLPDLILLDLAMPVMDGMTFLRRMRECPTSRNIPVLVLSAVAEKSKVLEAVRIGISGYLLKSRFSLDELLAKIAEHVGSPACRESSGGVDARAEAAIAGDPPLHAASRSQPAGRGETPSGSRPPIEIPGGVEPLEALKQIKPLMTRSEITDRLDNCDELKGMSPAVAQVLKLTGNARCSIEQIAKAISRDHAMALKVLKLANSAIYTRGEPVDSVQTAVMRIGLGQIRQTVLNLAVIEHFSKEEMGPLDPAQFWEHAIATGIISGELAHALNSKEIDAAFTMGLLHDVGRVYLAEQFGEEYEQALHIAEQLQLPLELVESRLLLYNHADVMDRILHAWKFPKHLINPIVFHHLSTGNIRRNAPRQLEEVAMLGLANRLAHAMMLGSSGNQTIYSTHDLCEMLKLEASVIERIHSMARSETDAVKFALLATTAAENWAQLRQVHRDAIGGPDDPPFRPLFVSPVAPFDACRIFCEELSDRAVSDEQEPPNIGVLHITHVRDRVPVTAAYRAAEGQHGMSELPLIVLSPAGKIDPEHSLLDGRDVAKLPVPFTIPRFTAAARALLAGERASTLCAAA